MLSNYPSQNNGAPEPYYQDKRVTIYHGDCREVLPQLESKPDLILTDPPYGIGYNAQKQRVPNSTVYGDIANDDSNFDLAFIFELDIPLAIFGANNFPHLLPHKGVWYCWDKRVVPEADKVIGSSFELIWNSKHTGYQKIFRVQHGAAINDNARNQPRLHPTEKPIRLLQLILQEYPDAMLVLDPFFGSGTTGMACKKLSRRCIGIEMEERYCEIAARRCSQ